MAVGLAVGLARRRRHPEHPHRCRLRGHCERSSWRNPPGWCGSRRQRTSCRSSTPRCCTYGGQGRGDGETGPPATQKRGIRGTLGKRTSARPDRQRRTYGGWGKGRKILFSQFLERKGSVLVLLFFLKWPVPLRPRACVSCVRGHGGRRWAEEQKGVRAARSCGQM